MIDIELIKTEFDKYKKLEISKKDLFDAIINIILGMNISDPLMVSRHDVLNILMRFKRNKISKQDLVDWVNIMWFSEWFTYVESESDCIASIMDKLEELDEEGKVLTEDQIEQYIDALQNNREVL